VLTAFFHCHTSIQLYLLHRSSTSVLQTRMCKRCLQIMPLTFCAYTFLLSQTLIKTLTCSENTMFILTSLNHVSQCCNAFNKRCQGVTQSTKCFLMKFSSFIQICLLFCGPNAITSHKIQPSSSTIYNRLLYFWTQHTCTHTRGDEYIFLFHLIETKQ